MSQQLSPVSERRTRFLTAVLQELTRNERDWSDARSRLEWAGALAAYATSVWSSSTPRIALIRLAALALACTEALDADPNLPTLDEERLLVAGAEQVCDEALMRKISASIKVKLKTTGGH